MYTMITSDAERERKGISKSVSREILHDKVGEGKDGKYQS